MACFEKNAEKYNKTKAVYYLKNAAIIKSRSADYRLAHPESVSSVKADWYERNRDVEIIKRREHYKLNRDRWGIYSQNRRARKRLSDGKLSPRLKEKLFVLQRGKCACCKQPLGNDYHMDHIVPLALGGANSDENMQLLRAKCNLQKGVKHPIEFMRRRGFLL